MAALPASTHPLIPWRYSLRGRLTLWLLALTVLPLAAVIVFAFWEAQTLLRERIASEMLRSGGIEADALESWIMERRGDLEAVAATARVRTMDPVKAGEAVQQYYDQWGFYQTMYLAGRDGQAIYVTDHSTLQVADRPYFQQALQGRSVFADPIVSRVTGELVFAVAAPVLVDGQVVGVVGGTLSTAIVAEQIARLNLGATGEAYLLNSAGFFITPSRFVAELRQTNQVKDRAELELWVDTVGARAALAGQTGNGEYADYRGRPVLGAYFPLASLGWALLVEQDAAEAFAPVTRLLTTLLIALAVTTALVVAAAWWVARGIAAPVTEMAEAAQRLAQGDVAQTLRAQGRDEIGWMATSFHATLSYMQTMAQVAGRLAEGDLTVAVTPRSAQDALGQAFAQMVASLRATFGRVAYSAGQLTTAAQALAVAAQHADQATQQISGAMGAVSGNARQQTATSAQAAGAVEQLRRAIDGVAHGAQEQAGAVAAAARASQAITAAIQQVSGRAQAVSQDSVAAAETAHAGGRTVTDTVRGMEAIKHKVDLAAGKVKDMGQRSTQIGAIVEAIEDIALRPICWR